MELWWSLLCGLIILGLALWLVALVWSIIRRGRGESATTTWIIVLGVLGAFLIIVGLLGYLIASFRQRRRNVLDDPPNPQPRQPVTYVTLPSEPSQFKCIGQAGQVCI